MAQNCPLSNSLLLLLTLLMQLCNSPEGKYKHAKIFCLSLLLMWIMLPNIAESKARDCSPLPECCRTFVFSPGCRGVAAKRNGPASIQRNSNFQRDPRSFSLDPDYGNENYNNLAAIVKSLALSDEGNSINNLKKHQIEAEYEK